MYFIFQNELKEKNFSSYYIRYSDVTDKIKRRISLRLLLLGQNFFLTKEIIRSTLEIASFLHKTMRKVSYILIIT